jgi:crotonobetainyl-CoA:carnitine CoA-transferase CaiB-like acyl-CoA transferase
VSDALPLPGPLSGLRVLELADETGQFCGKLLGDLGADVVKIEPPGGEPCRRIAPFLNDIPHPERSLSFWYYNTSKRGMTLDINTADGRDLFRRLAATADVVLETFRPGYLSSIGCGHEMLSRQSPGLILCSLTPFGQTGPWRDYLSSDLLHMAAGGEMASSGYDDTDVPDAPPIAPGGGNAWHMGCHFAYMAIVAALVHRTASGRGQYIDVSIHEACALTTESPSPITSTAVRCYSVTPAVTTPPGRARVPSSAPVMAITSARWLAAGSIPNISRNSPICSTRTAWPAISATRNTKTKR